ncbi:MAG: hypothetical protein ACRC33_20180 [Gemmataceae bacterium]
MTSEIGPDRVLVDEVRALPGGVESVRREPHRLGDYFESVRTLPPVEKTPTSFRLLFHRRPAAPRFWKDFMVRVLQEVREGAAGTTATLEYRGDEAPEGAAVGNGGGRAVSRD